MLRVRSLLLSLNIFFLLLPLNVDAALPMNDGERQRYDVQIDVRGAYISGVCMMLNDGGLIKATVVNEFGVTAISYTYDPVSGRVRLVSVMDMLDKWYIRRVLRRDLRHVMDGLRQDISTYENTKRKIRYQFIVLYSS